MLLFQGELADLDQLEGLPIEPFGSSPLEKLIITGLYGLSLLAIGFWLWMLYEASRRESDRSTWMWALIVAGLFGFRLSVLLPTFVAALYFFSQWSPGRNIRLPAGIRRLTTRRQMVQLETAAKQIGNAHQFVQWGDALRDVGQIQEADEAYTSALAKEPDNLPALWGAGQTNAALNQHEQACEKFRHALSIDSQYKFGDVSLALGRSLVASEREVEAREHLSDHIKRWRQPEALFLLASLESQQGETQRARELLEALILDVDGSPKGIGRRHAVWRSKAKRLLSKL